RGERPPPWAVGGGHTGAPNRVEVIRSDGAVEEHAVVTALEVNEGDVIRIHTGSGGGHGNPSRRPRELVLDDIRNGYVTGDLARSRYGLAEPARCGFLGSAGWGRTKAGLSAA